MFARLGPLCHDRRRVVLGLWIAVMILINGVSSSVGEDYHADFSQPGLESSDGLDLLEARFGGQGAGQTGTIVFEAEQGVDAPEVRAAMEALFADVADEDFVTRVESPYDPQYATQLVSAGSGRTIAYANVGMPEDVEFTDAEDLRNKILDEVPDIDGLNVELGGFIFAEFEEPTAELIGLAFAIVILIAAFGSVLAMGLPVGVALMGIGIGGAAVVLFSRVMEVPDFAPFIGIMIGLGVGIDYALLIVTRYREQLHAGHSVRESVQIAIDTAGRSVLFAGGTVVISLLGMFMMGIDFINGLAITASVTVAITVLASLTLLPALLGFAGMNVERTRWRGLVAAGFVALTLLGVGLDVAALAIIGLPLAAISLIAGFWVPALKKEVTHRPPKPRRETVAWRWSRIVQHRPWRVAIASAVGLLVLTIPMVGLRLGFSDESNFADDTTTKQAYDLLVEGFGEGYNGPLFLVSELPEGTNALFLGGIRNALEQEPEVASVFGPLVNEDGTVALWNVAPTTGPQEEATEDLVQHLRDDVLPPLEQEIGTDVLVTGVTAASIDSSDHMRERLPWFFLAVLALSFLLLLVVFRSLLVPLKAVIMNLLSIGAAYGVVVALFQWGWLKDLVGVEPGPIEPWAPMMLFAIVFGLSMDYEVFLLSRVREEWHRTGDSRTSVADGLAATAKVITAAAAIMVVVFGSFVLESDRTMKLMGIGLAVAILLDATVVRMLLVPATMELLGDRNWWLPRWLDRILPNIAVEGTSEAAPLDDEEEEREPALTGGD
ncbi:MAG TPA: MMPL family transporter [Acidimicrobiales bacterium]|nr:MMPL family transporter [Acidimicrobiales bacterium]